MESEESIDVIRLNSKLLQGNCKMINGKFIYRKTIGYMSRMAIDLRNFMIQEIDCGACCIRGENGPLRLSVYSDNVLILLWESRLRRSLPKCFIF